MKKIIIAGIITLFIFSCSHITGEKGSITNEQVENYLEAYKKLREKAPEILKDINENSDQTKAGKEGYDSVERIIQESGLESYAQFVILNAKIGTVFSMLQAHKGLNSQENLYESGQDMFDDSNRFIEEQLNDPEVPEETKVELRKTLEELKQNSNELKESYESNKAIANWVMNKAEKIQGLLVNESDIEVIQHYEEEIFEAYTGFPRPEGLEGNMPDLDTILW
jgi:predicted ribosome quality control (RQC) complex YloA/Tae2 family protein